MSDKLRAPRVLVVDDEPPTTVSFARMLQLEGYDVDTALDGETGLRLASGRAFDAILLDLRMPLLDGLEFLRRLRAIPSCHNTPVAIVTGHYLIDEATIAELERLGAIVRYKPLWFDDLLDLTRTLVGTC
jgi:two-component system, NtrC family, response regulator AtoC